MSTAMKMWTTIIAILATLAGFIGTTPIPASAQDNTTQVVSTPVVQDGFPVKEVHPQGCATAQDFPSGVGNTQVQDVVLPAGCSAVVDTYLYDTCATAGLVIRWDGPVSVRYTLTDGKTRIVPTSKAQQAVMDALALLKANNWSLSVVIDPESVNVDGVQYYSTLDGFVQNCKTFEALAMGGTPECTQLCDVDHDGKLDENSIPSNDSVALNPADGNGTCRHFCPSVDDNVAVPIYTGGDNSTVTGTPPIMPGDGANPGASDAASPLSNITPVDNNTTTDSCNTCGADQTGVNNSNQSANDGSQVTTDSCGDPVYTKDTGGDILVPAGCPAVGFEFLDPSDGTTVLCDSDVQGHPCYTSSATENILVKDGVGDRIPQGDMPPSGTPEWQG